MILDDIAARKRREIRRLREAVPLREWKARARDAPPLRDFPAALRSGAPPRIVAEIKRATPRGPLRPDAGAADFARRYAEGGAAAISCLTDAEGFRTTEDDLRAARDAVALPILRKEFVLDEYQIWQTRALPADAVLLIVRLLDRAQLADSIGLARDLGLAALVEAFDAHEIERALDAGAGIVGVNARDLETFRVDLERVAPLRAIIPAEAVAVAESGVRSPADVRILVSAGYDALLVGEELMTHPDPAARLRELLGRQP